MMDQSILESPEHPFMKIYFCLHEKENEEGQQLFVFQPIFKEGIGEEGTALRRYALLCMKAIKEASDQRPESERALLREELRAFLKKEVTKDREFIGPIGEKVIKFSELSPVMQQNVIQQLGFHNMKGPDGNPVTVEMDPEMLIEISVLESLGWDKGT